MSDVEPDTGTVGAEEGTAGEETADGAVPIPLPRPRPRGVVSAAMIGLAIGLGMEPNDEPTELVQPAEPHPDGLELDYGSLPPLDPPDG